MRVCVQCPCTLTFFQDTLMTKNHRGSFRRSAASISFLALSLAGCREVTTSSEVNAQRSVTPEVGSSVEWGPWSDPVNVQAVNSVAITRDGQTLGPAVPLTELNFAVAGITDAHPSVRTDGKEVIFFSNRPDGFGLGDLYVSTRQSLHST